MAKKSKVAKVNLPNPQKKPVFDNANISNEANCIYWSFSIIDMEGNWGFQNICLNRLHDLITSEFKSKEGLNWTELQASGSHNIECQKLVKEARQRLQQLKLDDQPELFSLRFSGKERLWGIRDRNVLRVLWWDPKHEVCPSLKKHT